MYYGVSTIKNSFISKYYVSIDTNYKLYIFDKSNKNYIELFDNIYYSCKNRKLCMYTLKI